MDLSSFGTFFQALFSNDYFWVGIIGLFVGVTEILSRYRDDPWRALINWGAALYVLVNVSATLVSLFLLKDVYQWNVVIDKGAENAAQVSRWSTVLVAGLGAMAFFRSSIFVFRVGDKDVPLGPGIVLQVLLDVTDRSVDRSRARPRATNVSKIMEKVEFSKAEAALPSYCFALMQNVSLAEQTAFANQVARLSANATMSPTVKSLALGLALMNIVGDAVLKAAVETLGVHLHGEPPPAKSPSGAAPDLPLVRSWLPWLSQAASSPAASSPAASPTVASPTVASPTATSPTPRTGPE